MGQIWNYVIVVMVALVVLYFIKDTKDGFNPDTLKGKNVIVTGASSGIGEEMAYQYCQMGANVFITARRKQLLEQVSDKCRLLGGSGIKVDYIEADMANMTNTQIVIKAAVASLGTIDYLMLNHAVVKDYNMSFWKGNDEDLSNLQQTMDINFRSFVHLTSYSMPYINKIRGAICAVSSIAGKLPNPLTLSYSSSKFALDGFYNGLRQELKMQKENITVTLAILGHIDTKGRTSALKRFCEKYNLNLDSLNSIFQPVSVEGTAFAIIESTTLGHDELYYPPSQWVRTKSIVRAIKTSLVEIDPTQ